MFRRLFSSGLRDFGAGTSCRLGYPRLFQRGRMRGVLLVPNLLVKQLDGAFDLDGMTFKLSIFGFRRHTSLLPKLDKVEILALLLFAEW